MPDEAPPDIFEKLRRYVDLKRRKTVHEAELKSTNEDIAALQAELLDFFAAQGVRNMTIDNSTVFLHRQLWARRKKDVPQAEVCAALEATPGLEHLVSKTFNTNTLSGVIRDYDTEGEPLPPELAAVIDVDEVFTVRTRSGA